MVIVLDDSKKVRKVYTPKPQVELKSEVLIKYGIKATIDRSRGKSKGDYAYGVQFNKVSDSSRLGYETFYAPDKVEAMKQINHALDMLHKQASNQRYTVGKYSFIYGTKENGNRGAVDVLRNGHPFLLKKYEGNAGVRRFNILVDNVQEKFTPMFEQVEKNYQLMLKEKDYNITYKGFHVISKVTLMSYSRPERKVTITYNGKEARLNIDRNEDIPQVRLNIDSYEDTPQKIKDRIDEYIKKMDEMVTVKQFKANHKVLVKDVDNSTSLVENKKTKQLYMVKNVGIFSSKGIVEQRTVAEMIKVAIYMNDYSFRFDVSTRYGARSEYTRYETVVDYRIDENRVKTGWTSENALKSHLNRLMKPYLKALKNTPEEKARMKKLAIEKIALDKKREEQNKIREEIKDREEKLRKLRE